MLHNNDLIKHVRLCYPLMARTEDTIKSSDPLSHISAYVCTVDSIQEHELLISFTDNLQYCHSDGFQFLQSVYGPDLLNFTYTWQ